MINPNANGNYPVDLRNVTHVRIGNQWTDIRPGTFTLGTATFFLAGRGEEGNGMWRTFGPDVPLSYFFLDTGGNLHTGPYHHIQEMKATRPETDENEEDYQS